MSVIFSLGGGLRLVALTAVTFHLKVEEIAGMDVTTMEIP